ncbi:hypothetical protein Tco_0380148, partial [Tanacetum coccineum]
SATTHLRIDMTKYYNARVRGVAFRPGDFVYCSNDASHAAAGGKLGPKWEGPYEVTEALGDGAYKLRTMAGADMKHCQSEEMLPLGCSTCMEEPSLSLGPLIKVIHVSFNFLFLRY